MSIAGDHAHNDLWGLEAMAEDDDVSNVEINTNEYSWRERLEKLGFKVDRTFESHPIDQARRIIMELENQGVTLPQPPLCDVYIANLGAEAKQPAYLLCQQLRDLGVRAEEDLCGRSLKAQFKYADKIAARYIVIVGGDELARGTVKARNLSTREEQEIPLDGAAEAIRALAQG